MHRPRQLERIGERGGPGSYLGVNGAARSGDRREETGREAEMEERRGWGITSCRGGAETGREAEMEGRRGR